MQLQNIIEIILNTKKSVFIPSVGLLKVENSEVLLDRNGSGSVLELISVISVKKGISAEAAEQWLNKELSSLRSSSSIQIGAFGTLSKGENGDFSFEKKKANIFPTDFFSSTPVVDEDEVEEEVVEEHVQNMTEVVEENQSTIQMIDDDIEDEVEDKVEEVETKVEDNVEEIQEKTEEIVHEVEDTVEEIDASLDKKIDEVKEKKSSFIDKAKSLFGSSVKNVSEVVEDAVENVTDLVEDVIDNVEEVTEDVVGNIQDAVETVVDKVEDSVDILEDKVEENIDSLHNKYEDVVENIDQKLGNTGADNVQEENHLISDDESLTAADLFPEEQMPVTLDEENMHPYDIGYYNYLLNKKDSNTRKVVGEKRSWGRVASILLLLGTLAFFIPWIVASFNGNNFLGMSPLWNSSSEKKQKKEKVIVKKEEKKAVDTMAVDSVEMNRVAKENEEFLAAQNAEANEKKVPSTTNTTSTGIKSTSKSIATNTSNRRNSVSTSTKKSSGSTSTSSTSSSITKSNTFSISSGSSSTDISKNVKAAVSPKEYERKKANTKIIGGPYATANYTKGNHYVSFGAFRVPKNAKRLRSDLKKVGVVTDVVVVDGMYKVVIPYVSKKHALKAASEFGNTTVFQ